MPRLQLDMEYLERKLGEVDADCANLFAFPAQSNFTGVNHPSGLVEKEREKGWYLLLDAAAFEDGPMNYLSVPAVEIGLR